MEILRINSEAAAAGVATTEDAIALTSAVTKAYGDTPAAAVQQASDLALVTVRLGQTSFPELAAAIGKTTPLAAQIGVRQEELAASYATLTGVVGSTSKVSTGLRGILSGLIRPTKGLREAVAALGAAGYRRRRVLGPGNLKDGEETTGGSAWESNPAPPRQRGATDFEDREGHRAPFASPEATSRRIRLGRRKPDDRCWHRTHARPDACPCAMRR